VGSKINLIFESTQSLDAKLLAKKTFFDLSRPFASKMILPFGPENDVAARMQSPAEPSSVISRHIGNWAVASFRANRFLDGRIIFGRRCPYGGSIFWRLIAGDSIFWRLHHFGHPSERKRE